MEKRNVIKALASATKRIAPAWTLQNQIAVNPYVGMADFDFKDAATVLANRGGIRTTMPIAFYLKQIEEGKILAVDLEKALEQQSTFSSSVETFISICEKYQNRSQNTMARNYTMVRLASEKWNRDWVGLQQDILSTFLSDYYDGTVSSWEDNKSTSLYKTWKERAKIDRSHEVAGLKSFRSFAKLLPTDREDLITSFINETKLSESQLENYFHALLLQLPGWSSYIAGIDFQRNLYGGENDKLYELIAILVAWDYYFFSKFNSAELKNEWFQYQLQTTFKADEKREYLELELILQDALDFASQRELQQKFAETETSYESERPLAQAVFCIDVRSEVFRRNLERINPSIHTYGFAGFFGFPVTFEAFGEQTENHLCPALIPSSLPVKEIADNPNQTRKKELAKGQVESVWKKFKKGAITSFGFVSPLGITFLPRIVARSFRPAIANHPANQKRALRHIDLSSLSVEQQVQLAKGALTGMGLTKDFAPFVLIAGHGSKSENNPHASGLECGACGGHAGDVNALVAQQIFNNPAVRRGLVEEGIEIPEDTTFLAALHNTTTDEITFVNETSTTIDNPKQFFELRVALTEASEATRNERAGRLNIAKNSPKEFAKRAQDWSEVRPEWGLSGCHSFIVAPRERTKGIDLGGQSFLHSYNYKKDESFSVLESIMTAPMVVTSWINLQYFGSTVDQKNLGAGNKTLHNVTGGIGVLEGAGGDLRLGLPHQSIHNGAKYEHLPIRINVVIEAPTEAMDDIMNKHEHVKDLIENGWINLFQLDANGNIHKKCKKHGEWETLNVSHSQKNKELLTA